MRGPKRFARGADEIAFERFFRSERDRVQHEVQSIRLTADVLKKLRDVFVARHVAWPERRFFTKLADQFFDVLANPLTLEVKEQLRPGRSPRLRDCPRDAPLVRHPEHDADF